MKQWYSFYSEHFTKSQQHVGQIDITGKIHQLGEQLTKGIKSQQLVGFLEMPEEFGLIPWGHHIQIISLSTIAL